MRRPAGDPVRTVRLFFGLFLYAVGIVLTVHANIGASPWDVFHLGLGQHMGWSLGMANVATSTVVVAIAALMGERIGFGTLSNVIAIGVFLDVIIESGYIPVLHSLPAGIAMLVAGLFVIALATVFYIGAGYGAGPRDSLMVALTRRTNWTPGFCKGCIEGLALFCGWLLGGKVGIGTVISAFGIGVAVQVVFSLLRFKVEDVRQESFRETLKRLFSRFRRG